MAPSVLVVCLGNICRSPMGEAVLRNVASQRGLDITVDSAGTAAYHVGDPPDERSVATCEKHNIPISHEGRQVHVEDFKTFSHILAADASNLRNLKQIEPTGATADIRLWGSYDDGKAIADPYYGGTEGFETCYKQCVRYSDAFLDDIFGKQDAISSL